MKKSKKSVRTVFVVLFALCVFSLTSCGQIGDDIGQADTAVQYEILKAEPKSTEVWSDVATARTQDDAQEQGGGMSSIMRAYSDSEKERMAELEQFYQNEITKPEKMIQEVDSAGSVTEGTLCYIRSTGEYYLPERELTDEELLEIIDCNFRIAVNSQGWSQEKIDEVNQKERAMLEEKVQAAGGLSEKQAIEIAQKAMETDLGDRGRKLKLIIDEPYGWSSDLRVADWSEIKEEDRGEIAYCIEFNNAENVMDWKELRNYVCVINAVDGSILEAYEIQGFDSTVYYEH